MKLLNILLETQNSSIESSIEEEDDSSLEGAQKKIQEYIKNRYKGNFRLLNAPVETLPENFRVEGSLTLWDCGIKYLPKGLKIGGDLIIANSGEQKFEELPSGLEVGRDVEVVGTKIKKIPEDIKLTARRRKLELFDNQIELLPNNFYVNGDLILRNNPIKELPKGLVARYLDLRNTQITELPPDLVVHILDASNTPLKHIPKTTRIIRSVNLENTPFSKRYDDDIFRILKALKLRK